ncbi:hypothetical protein NHH03_21185 [Stieleria sp. TO1_6]|uniref:hypothetical protein n=1 Tax=Stieleria tagensis TaxID=2956795 RepID=UPI00209A8A82|nr:hypothetical protein [Stieleria tagensis]MCO8124270.1 hypothetical protein [Stieleria tagensis]
MNRIEMLYGTRQQPNRSRHLAFLIAAMFVLTFGSDDCARSQNSAALNSGSEYSASKEPLPTKILTVIPAGTQVEVESSKARWNRLLLIATPKLDSGEIESINASIRNAATTCSLTLMATVIARPPDAAQPSAKPQYELVEVGVGYGVATNRGTMIVSSDTVAQQTGELGFFARRMLSHNEQQLRSVREVARTKDAVVFDAPSVFSLHGTHRKCLTRHLVALDRSTGQGWLYCWLLLPVSDDTAESHRIVDHPIRATRWGTQETRSIHVDANEFNFLGVPSELAMALVDLPPGTDIPWAEETTKLAGRRRLTASQLQRLAERLTESR